MRPRHLVLRASVLVPALMNFGYGHAAELDDASRAAIDKATASVRWAGSYQCPSIGLPIGIKGMQTEAETQAQQQSSWAFAQSVVESIRAPLAQREAVLKQAKKNDNYDDQLAAIDAQVRASMARAGTALVNWSLANWVDMARTDPTYAGAPARHPLQTYVQRGAQLDKYAGVVQRLPGANEFVQPVADKFQRCLLLAQNQVVEANADTIRAAATAATSSSAVSALARSYAVADSSFQGEGVKAPEVILAVQARADQLAQAERVAAAEAARRASVAATAGSPASRAVSTQTQAAGPSPAELQANLRIATRVVEALQQHAVPEVMKSLHNDVVMSSPFGTATGKSAVQSSLVQGFSSGRSGSITPPTISSGQIVSSIQSARGNAIMYFGFRDGLVSSMRIR